MIRSRRSAGRSRAALAALVTVGGVVLAGCAAGQQAQTAEQYPTVDGANAEVGTLALRNIALEYPDDGVYRKGSVARLRLLIANTGNASDTLTDIRTEVATEIAIEPGQEESEGTGESASPTEGAAPSTTPSETGEPTGTPTETGEPSGTATETGPASPPASPPGTATPTATQSPAASPTEAGGEVPGATVTILPNNAVSIGEGTSQTAILLRGLTQELRSSQVVSITFVFSSAGSVTVPVPVAIPEEREPAPTIPAEPEE